MRKTPSDFDRNNRRYEQKLYHNPLTIALKKPKKFKSSPIGSVRELFLQHHVNLVPHTQSDDVIRWIKRQTTEHCVRLANLRYTNSSEMQPLTNGRVLTSAKSMYQHKVGARPLGKILQENAPPPSSRSFMLRHPWSLLPPKQYLNVFPTFYCSVPFNILVGVVYLHRVQRRNNGVSILTMCTKS